MSRKSVLYLWAPNHRALAAFQPKSNLYKICFNGLRFCRFSNDLRAEFHVVKINESHYRHRDDRTFKEPYYKPLNRIWRLAARMVFKTCWSFSSVTQLNKYAFSRSSRNLINP